MKIVSKIRKKLGKSAVERLHKAYLKRFQRYAFVDCGCTDEKQYEASITRLYHTIEKGLSYGDYRAGFGKDNISKLLTSLEAYSAKYSTERFFYKTALSCLNEYIRKNKEHGYVDESFNARVKALSGEANDMGGVITVSAPDLKKIKEMSYEQLVTERHSIRHFSGEPVEIKVLKEAIALAQHTPSACNRQGWRTIIVKNKKKLRGILSNQNGNRGFGEEIDKLLVITADIRYFQKNRELYQPYIDGGMYAQSIINSLYYKGVGSVPLSASLTPEQEKKVREITGMDDSEVLIMFIGVGTYPKVTLTTRSERKTIDQITCI